VALAEASGSSGRPGRITGAARVLSLGSVPPPALVLFGVLSVQVGAGLAKHLFAVLPPSAVVLLRLFTSALVLTVLGRKALAAAVRGRSRRDLALAAVFGLTLAVMNFSIYLSFQRIPLGVAVTIEFLGPLLLTIAASRRLIHLVWAALAFLGVLLLARGGSGLDPVGVAFALVAGAAWAGYILCSAATGRRFPGSTGLALASIVATALMLPAGVAGGGSTLLRPELLLVGLGVGLLSSVIPYTLELEALRRMPTRVFGILMSLEPAAAALVGLVVLGEILSAREWLAIGCVMVACIGATKSQEEPPEAPEG
jgi:inner membrane transporter RhtA